MRVHGIVITVALWLLAGCATTTQVKVSTQEKKQMQARVFEDVTYDGVYRAFKTVIRQEGYIMREESPAKGALIAEVQRRDKASGIWEAVQTDRRYRMNERYEFQVNLRRTDAETVVANTRLLHVEPFSIGGRREEEIVDKNLYGAFYAKVQEELERRKATGKK